MSDYHVIEGAKIVHQTEKAILVEASIFVENEWIPQAAVHDDSPIYRNGEEGDLYVKEWFADRQGWI